MYIDRSMELALTKLKSMFSIILLTGSRQVGKTTLLKHLFQDLPYLTLDDPTLLQSIVEEPGNFLKKHSPPLIIDEVQYAPILFRYLKMKVDENNEKGQFFLTGSQQFHLMKNVSETLAGRIGIINLLGLSLREIQGVHDYDYFIPKEPFFQTRQKTVTKISYWELWKIIHKGAMPALYADNIDWQMFYSAYIKTYIERDVQQLTQVGDNLRFLTFMTVIANRTGQLLNLTSIARDVGISITTAERWLSILLASNVIYLLAPFHNNRLKRAIKTPKLYFLDTGLAAFLTKWNNTEVLESGAMNGAFFETFVVGEILKSYFNAGILHPPLYFYRDKEGVEIDLLIEINGFIHPLEINKSSNPTKSNIKAFDNLEKKVENIGEGGIICLYDDYLPIGKKHAIIPVHWL